MDKNTKFINKVVVFIMILFLCLVIVFNIYLSGGTQTAFTQLNFIPIILVSYYFGAIESVLTAVFLGLLVGPFMPLNVSLNIMQTTDNWMLRILIYVIIAVVIGFVLDKNRKLNNEIIEKDSIDLFTGLYNQNILFPLLDEMLKKDREFNLVIIKINNLDQIEKYIDKDLVDLLIKKIIADIKNIFEDSELYDIHSDEFALVYKSSNEEDLNDKVKFLIDKRFTSVSLNDYVFSMIITVGIYNVNENETDALNIYNKARVAVDQGNIYESGIYRYDKNLYDERKLNFEISSTLLDSLNNQEFYLVYQPVICLREDKIVGLEVLTRWNRGDKTAVGPQLFIDIAEKIGCITDFSLWIASETIRQVKEWEKKNIILETSINLTSRELLDKRFVNIMTKKISDNNIDRTLVSLEITERVFANEIEGLQKALEDFRASGYKISIDDFGTGYNSLKFVGDIPFDILKIDKYFIDRIGKYEMETLVANMINAAHQMNKLVVAEGVEEEYQAKLLIKLGCDLAQGYYYSKPLLPDDFEEFYFKYNSIS